jgi:uncharacterized membrane protein YkoI
MRLVSGTLGAVEVLAFVAPALASPCPANVADAVLKAHVGAVVNECKQETEDGKLQYEVKITSKDGKRMELDVDFGGKILLTEEYVELADVPAAVLTAFTARFPGAKASRAEKLTALDGKVIYEIAFADGAAKKEATFTADGAPVEEERGQD